MPTPPLHTFLRRLTRAMAVEAQASEPDRQLVQRFLDRRDEAAFEALVRRHGPMVYRVCWRVLQRAQDAEDAFQATFLLLAQKPGTVRKLDSLASWLHGVARRVALKAKAQGATRRRYERQAPAAVALPRDEVTWGELRMALDDELARLPEKWRLPLTLCYLEGRTQDEAARQQGLSRTTFQRRLEEARAALGRRLSRRGVVWPAALSAALVADCAALAVPSSRLFRSTVKAGASVAAGQSPASITSARVAALAEGVRRTMLLSRFKPAAAAALALALGAALVAGTCQLSARERAPNGNEAAPARPADARKPAPPGKFHGNLVLFGVQKADPDNPQVAGGQSLIVTMKPDGAKVETVFTAPPGNLITMGRIAPDGQRLAFNLQAQGAQQEELWLLDRTGQARKLADDAQVCAWSPDGEKLLCRRGKDRQWASFFIAVDRLPVKEERVPLPDSDWAEDWSPDSKGLSAVHYPEKHFHHPLIPGPYPLRQSYLVGLDGKKGPKLSTDPMHDDLWPRFSPDGRHLAYSQRRHEGGKIFYSLMLYRSDGRGAKELVSLNKLAEQGSYDDMRGNSPPCWSPDGKTVAYLALGSKNLGTPQITLSPELIFASPEKGLLRRVRLGDLGIHFAGKVDWR